MKWFRMVEVAALLFCGVIVIFLLLIPYKPLGVHAIAKPAPTLPTQNTVVASQMPLPEQPDQTIEAPDLPQLYKSDSSFIGQVKIGREHWTEIDWQTGEHFNGDVLESNVVIVGRTQRFGPATYSMPTKESGLDRRIMLGSFIHVVQIHVSADSPADTGTYKYTITR
jgi:hypothetical protein